ncbi:MAG: cytochrome P450 [Rhizobacter sp.]
MKNPYPHYAQMRTNAPVFFNETLQMWEVYGYHDIQAVLADPSTFSSDISALQTMVTMDPPRHTQLRKLVARAFTAKLMASLEPKIQAITDELLDGVAATGRMDVISGLAFPLPVTVIAELLGLPTSDRARFKQWSVPAIRAAEMELQGQKPEPHLIDAVGELTHYLEALIVQRQQLPQEDLLSGLAHANVDGESLTMDEITSTCRLLLIAGFETTANLIGNTIHLLLTHPNEMAKVRADAELLPTAIDEALRYHAPFQFFARRAQKDVTLGGQTIRAGQLVMTLNASGNRDESVFVNADIFDATRSPNRHLSFGHGIHYCLGAGLGRIEGKIGIGSLLKRFADIRIDEEVPAQWLSSPVLFGFSSLTVQFTPV